MTVAPALAAGNCVVLKPPEIAPWSVLRLGELFLEAGLPPGVVNVVPAGPEGGDALVRHPDVDYIHFTGSGPTARLIMRAAAETLKPVGLELGGKSARIVFDDADVPGAVAEAVGNLSSLSGQGCIYGMRLLAHVDVYDQVVELTKSYAENVAIGDPLAPTTFMGPVATEGAMNRILGVIDRPGREGARLVTGGERLGGDLSSGYFPTCALGRTSTRTRSSGPSWGSPRSRTRPRRSAWPTRRPTGWRATSGPRTSCAPIVSPRRSRPATSGSTA